MSRHRILGVFALFACLLLGRPAVAQQTFFGVFFTDAHTGTVVGGAGTILRTTNGGATWTPQFSGTTQDLRSVFFTDANTGTVVGTGGTILRTTDGGATWIPQSSGTNHSLLSVFFTDANTGTAVGGSAPFPAEGTILRTIDGGATWTPQSSGTTEVLLGVAFTDANTGTAVGVNGTIVRTIDGGAKWTPEGSGTNALLIAVSFANTNTGTAVGEFGMILRTTDGGATWSAQSSGTTENLWSVFLTSANTGIAVGGQYGDAPDSMILRTTDGGATWMRQFADTFSPLLSVSFADANTGTAVGELNTILRTTDGGNTWISQLVVTGVYPAMSESPHSLSFGNQIVGSSSLPQTVILSNTGTAPLQFNAIYTTGDFSETTACSSPLAPGTSCSIAIVFTPTARYARTGTLVISSSQISETDTLTLSGSGTVAIAQLSPGSLNFGNQRVKTSSAPQNVTLLNAGDGPLTLRTIFTTGPYSQTNNCGTSIAPGTGCNIAVVFTPTVRGTVNGTLSITGNQQGTAPVTALVGTGH